MTVKFIPRLWSSILRKSYMEGSSQRHCMSYSVAQKAHRCHLCLCLHLVAAAQNCVFGKPTVFQFFFLLCICMEVTFLKITMLFELLSKCRASFNFCLFTGEWGVSALTRKSGLLCLREQVGSAPENLLIGL